MRKAFENRGSGPMMFFRHMDRRASLRKYQVNLLVDNGALDHAPVIFESIPLTPTFSGKSSMKANSAYWPPIFKD